MSPIVTKDDWLVKTDQEAIDRVYDLFVRGMAPRSCARDESALCLYSGDHQGCAVGCLMPEEQRKHLDAFGQKTIGFHVSHEIVSLPYEMTLHSLSKLQLWHDNCLGGYMQTQEDRHKSFPFLGRVTNPIKVTE